MPNRILRLEVSAPAALSDEVIRKLIEDAISTPAPAKRAAKSPRKAVARPVLRTRKARHAGTFPCRREPNPLMKHAILWPVGVPHKGCGRTFATERRRDLHEKGEGWNTSIFPNACLDRILPADLRDTR